MAHISQRLDELLQLINNYPSPHNGQPMRIKQVEDDVFDIYFQRERGLQAADVSLIFSFVSMGVFIQYIQYACIALGHKMTYKLDLPAEKSLRGSGNLRFARSKIEWGVLKPNNETRKALMFRQTSRKKYSTSPSEDLMERIEQLSTTHQKLYALDKKQSQKAIWLNQRAVFDDMFDSPTRRELDHWLRYSKKEKEEKRDGLSYDCMELNGTAMKYIVDHYKVLRAPGISWILKQYYLRTMKDESLVLYMLAPFESEKDSFDVGLKVMQIWQLVSEYRHYLHPFGTIMSNHAAHRDFLKIAGIDNESRSGNYLVFIFRLGISDPPVASLRLDYRDHLIME